MIAAVMTPGISGVARADEHLRSPPGGTATHTVDVSCKGTIAFEAPVARALEEAGAMVYRTGQSVRGNRSPYDCPETIEEPIAMISWGRVDPLSRCASITSVDALRWRESGDSDCEARAQH